MSVEFLDIYTSEGGLVYIAMLVENAIELRLLAQRQLRRLESIHRELRSNYYFTRILSLIGLASEDRVAQAIPAGGIIGIVPVHEWARAASDDIAFMDRIARSIGIYWEDRSLRMIPDRTVLGIDLATYEDGPFSEVANMIDIPDDYVFPAPEVEDYNGDPTLDDEPEYLEITAGPIPTGMTGGSPPPREYESNTTPTHWWDFYNECWWPRDFEKERRDRECLEELNRELSCGSRM